MPSTFVLIPHFSRKQKVYFLLQGTPNICIKSTALCSDKVVKEPLLTELTTFSRGAAPNTLKTGLGLEGEIHSTMACWPTLVVYSSRVARSFLKTRTRQSVSCLSGMYFEPTQNTERTRITQWCYGKSLT